MEKIFMFIHSAMPVLYAAAIALVLLKAIMVSRQKGFIFLAIFLSFFKMYTFYGQSSHNRKRKKYMLYNNAINSFIYVTFLLFILMLVIFKGNIFNYS